MIAKEIHACPRCGAEVPASRSICPQCQWLITTPYPLPRRRADATAGRVIVLPAASTSTTPAAPQSANQPTPPVPPRTRRGGWIRALVYAALGYVGMDALVHGLAWLGWVRL